DRAAVNAEQAGGLVDSEELEGIGGHSARRVADSARADEAVRPSLTARISPDGCPPALSLLLQNIDADRLMVLLECPASTPGCPRLAREDSQQHQRAQSCAEASGPTGPGACASRSEGRPARLGVAGIS